MTKTNKAESNRSNALKSTGPKTPVGKSASSQNSLRHGVLSSHLILPNESRDEFDALLAELQQEFMPQGLLEMSLIERIAIALWRQRRLVRAESAGIELRQSDSRSIASKEIRDALGLEWSDARVEDEWSGIASFKNERNTHELLEYIHLLQRAIDDGSELDELEKKYPVIYQELKEVAIQENQTKCVQTLLTAGAKVNLADVDGTTPLMVAALKGFTPILVLLLEKGANVYTQNNIGFTALMWAVQEEKDACVDKLLSAGANVNLAIVTGQTPLMMAATKGFTPILAILLEKGTNIDAQDNKGATALMIAPATAGNEPHTSRTSKELSQPSRISALRGLSVGCRAFNVGCVLIRFVVKARSAEHCSARKPGVFRPSDARRSIPNAHPPCARSSV